MKLISVVCDVFTSRRGSGLKGAMRQSASCKDSVTLVTHMSVDGSSRTYIQNWHLYLPV